MKYPVYQQIATCLEAAENCRKSNNTEWLDRHLTRARRIAREALLSGSGVDNGTSLYDNSTAKKLVFAVSFHHMDDGGMYDGWTEHEVIVTPSLTNGFDLRVTGRDRNDIKEYLAEAFDSALRELIDLADFAEKDAVFK